MLKSLETYKHKKSDEFNLINDQQNLFTFYLFQLINRPVLLFYLR